MLEFLKKVLGLPTKEEIAEAKSKTVEVPYKIEQPVINNKTGEPVLVQQETKVEAVTPVKKTRKPRTPKVETPVKEKAVKEKAAKPVKAAAAKKEPVKRSKKA